MVQIAVGQLLLATDQLAGATALAVHARALLSAPTRAAPAALLAARDLSPLLATPRVPRWLRAAEEVVAAPLARTSALVEVSPGEGVVARRRPPAPRPFP
jgi:hypothetical protein